MKLVMGGKVMASTEQSHLLKVRGQRGLMFHGHIHAERKYCCIRPWSRLTA